MHHWRLLVENDIDAVIAIAAIVHPGFPEDRAVLAERRALAPQSCFLLQVDGQALGYCLAHPYTFGSVPPLNRILGRLPEAPDTFYIHDLSLLPQAQGTGAARAIVEKVTELAQPFPSMSLVAVNKSTPFWQAMGFACRNSLQLASYGPDACYMVRHKD